MVHAEHSPRPLTRAQAEHYLAWLDVGHHGLDTDGPNPPAAPPAALLPRSLADLAWELQAWLVALAVDPSTNPPAAPRFEAPRAFVAPSRRVAVAYGRGLGSVRFTRAEAEAYVLALRAGFRGRHTDPDPPPTSSEIDHAANGCHTEPTVPGPFPGGPP